MLYDIGWRIFCFFLGALITLIILAWCVSGTPDVLQKRQNDAMIAACEQDLIRSEHCILIAIPESNLK